MAPRKSPTIPHMTSAHLPSPPPASLLMSEQPPQIPPADLTPHQTLAPSGGRGAARSRQAPHVPALPPGGVCPPAAGAELPAAPCTDAPGPLGARQDGAGGGPGGAAAQAP